MKRQKDANFYLPLNFEHTWQEFKLITERENSSASEKLREFIRGYVDRHKHGNPQTLLKTFGSELRVVCLRCQKSFTETEVRRVLYKSGWEATSCWGCVKKDKARGLVKKVWR